MINNSKTLAFLAIAALLMVAATARYYPNPEQPNEENEQPSYDNKEEPKVPGLVAGNTGTGPVSLSTNPLSGSVNVGPVHAEGTAKRPMNGCINAPGIEGCAKSGHPMKGHLKTPAGTLSGEINAPVDPELPVEGVPLN